MYQIFISNIAEKQLATFPKHIANNITAKIDLLSENPRPMGCKKLEGSDKNTEYVPEITGLFIELKMLAYLWK